MLNWFYARTAILTNDMPEAFEYFMLAFQQAKYHSGSLFNYLILDVSAFCKIQYKAMKKQGNDADFDRLYQQLGGDIHKWGTLLGYTAGSARNKKNLLPYSLNSQHNLKLNNDVEATLYAMEKAIGACSTIKKGE